MSATRESFDQQLEDRIRSVAEADDAAGALTPGDYRVLFVVTLLVPAVLLFLAAL
jgi:hypothetical protein